MINKKMRKLVYLLSKNSRIRTKDLGKNLNISQQSASYLIKSCEQRKTILGYTTVIDPAKVGSLGIIVYYNFVDFSPRNIQEIVTFLHEEDSVVKIRILDKGYDLSCTFRAPNLSYFNKANRDFLQEFKGKILVAEIFPMVVKYIYPKSYLIPQKKKSDGIIISGDRDIVQMTENEKKVSRLLRKSAGLSIIEMARKLRLNPKTVIKTKTKLEKNKIIRGYSTLWDYKTLGIETNLILVSTEGLSLREDKKLSDFCRDHPNIVGFSRLIGIYDMLIEVEGENITSREVLKEIRSEFNIKQFKVLEGGIVLKDKYVPNSALE